MRIGLGYDSHRFMAGKGVPIGGVEIAHCCAVEAHSDGDVLLHALIDALLGAAALGDIGQHFPDNDRQYAGVASSVLLTSVLQLLLQKKYKINNIDATIVVQNLRLSPYLLAIRQNIARLLNIALDCVSVKAKTNEKMGWIGRDEGLAAQVVVLIVQDE